MELNFGSICVRNPQTAFDYAQPHMEPIIATTTFSYDDPEALMEIFLGEKKGRELSAHLAAADVFVFPSLTDTFGVVQLEALACGVRQASALLIPRTAKGHLR